MNFDSTIISSVEELEQLRQKQNVVFRGVNNAYYGTYSSLQRAYDANIFYKFASLHCREVALKRLIDKVKKEEVIRQLPTLSDYNILALMQHYGLASPLLDFSLNIEIALSFAFMRNEDSEELSDYVSIYTLPHNDANLICSLPNQAEHNAAVCEIGIEQLDEYTRNRLVVSSEIITSDSYDAINDYRLIEGGLRNISLQSLGIKMVAGNNNPNRELQNGLFLQTPLTTSPIEKDFYEKYGYKITSYEIPSAMEEEIRGAFKLFSKDEIYSNSKESIKIRETLNKYK